MLGEKIRKIRTLKGFSQDYMADKLKMSQPAYSDIEKSKTKIGLEMIEKICSIFEIASQDLINFDESQIFNNTFSENSKGYFNIKKFYNESFENERKANNNLVQSLQEEIAYLRKKLDDKP